MNHELLELTIGKLTRWASWIAATRREAEAHAAACSDCREELATLRLTLDALSTLREEEIPRRIAFVSDKVFEPRWWQASFLRPSFAGACVIAAGDSGARASLRAGAAIQTQVAASMRRRRGRGRTKRRTQEQAADARRLRQLRQIC